MILLYAANEITSIRSKYSAYVQMDKTSSLIHRVRLEATRYYNRRLLPYTRRRRVPVVTLPGNTTAPPPLQVAQVQEEPMDSMAFTASVENILSAYLNRNREIEYSHGLVALVAPVSHVS